MFENLFIHDHTNGGPWLQKSPESQDMSFDALSGFLFQFFRRVGMVSEGRRPPPFPPQTETLTICEIMMRNF